MTPFLESGLHAIRLGLLRSASLLTPGTLRAEWSREWQSELWHVRRECSPKGRASWHAEREMTAFCLGAFQDAFCLRRHAWRRGSPPVSLHGSAAQCILALVAVLAASYGVSLLIPGVRVTSHPPIYNPGLILIQKAGSADGSTATIPAQEFLAWNARRQRYFDGIAFYRMGHETVEAGSSGFSRLRVAHASANLFALLGIPLEFAATEVDAVGSVPTMILSDEVWMREFHANQQIIGSVVRMGSRQVKIGGVAPEGSWRLPGNAGAWLLEPDNKIEGVGYVVAHLTALGRSEMSAQSVPITSLSADDDDDNLWGMSFEERTQGPLQIYLFTVVLAFLALPAITSVSMGEYSFNAHRSTWTSKLCRWGFLGAKFTLLMPIVYFSSLDLSYWHTTSYSTASQYLHLISSFLICLFGLRWVLLDQRQRCPVCLRRVTHPARVGQASHTFLAWNGTELMCTDGHTLLHVPALPTSWFSTQRWLYLDTSWEFLFAAHHVESTVGQP